LAGFFGKFGSFAPSYTISFELLFYTIWGVVFSFALERQAIPISAAGGVILFFLLPSNFTFAVVLFASWLLGAAIAIHEAEVKAIFARVPLWATWLVVLTAFIAGNQWVVFHGINWWEFPGSLLTLPGALLFALIIGSHLAKSRRAMELDNWLGEISYPLFLVHGPVLIAVGSLLKLSGIAPVSFGMMTAILMGSVIASAHLVLVLLERPVMRIRRLVMNPSRTVPIQGTEPPSGFEILTER
jgi:peptidoglycan/LPS O-acetylase OafA/YrhL